MVENKDFRHIVRLAEADLNGNKKLLSSLRKVKGVGFSFANAICTVSGIKADKQVGSLTEEDIKKLTDVIKNPEKFKIFSWLYNRKKDFATGKDTHLVGSELKLQKEFDIKHLKKIKCYRGVRHSQGLPVRGQRTRGNFRHGRTIGVRRKGLKTAASGDKK
ncbi:MAG: 30S ribosomal protein S13 [Nanoarchaeota archaeon]|nr:30S ribosomal protein S13 [Nanoarchaeota archaeon]|tara:strand:- start:405 stop:887 length:483 start_codon:yes stop_codon:yes gene_type:complete